MRRTPERRATEHADSVRCPNERGTNPHDWIRRAWLAGYRAAQRDAKKGKRK